MHCFTGRYSNTIDDEHHQYLLMMIYKRLYFCIAISIGTNKCNVVTNKN